MIPFIKREKKRCDDEGEESVIDELFWLDHQIKEIKSETFWKM